jgi:hypothetical protein
VQHEDGPAEQDEQKRRKKRGRRRRKRRKDEDTGDWSDALETAESVSAVGGGCSRLPGCGRGGRSGGDSGCGSGSGSGGGRGGCDGCDGPCDFSMLRLSALLLVAAALMPERLAGRRLVKDLVQGVVRGYQRRLTRFTPTCPSTPSCSAYALAAVESFGARRGLVAAAERIRSCGTR